MQPVTQLDILSRTLMLLYLMQVLGALHLFPLFFTLPPHTLRAEAARGYSSTPLESSGAYSTA